MAMLSRVGRGIRITIDWFARYSGDAEADRRTRLVIGFALAAIAAAVLLNAVNIVAHPRTVPFAAAIIALFISVLGAMRRGLSTPAAAHLLLGIGFVVLQGSISVNGGLLAASAVLAVAGAVAAALLLPPRQAAPWAAAWAIAPWVRFAAVDSANWAVSLASPATYAATQTVVTTLTFGLALIFERSRIAAWEALDGEKREVERQHAELESAIAELHHTQRQLIQSQKMEALGRLAGGAAHEINTPIQYIKDNVAFLDQVVGDLLAAAGNAQRLIAATDGGPLAADVVAELQATLDDADMEFVAEDAPTAAAEAQDGLDQIGRIVATMKAFADPENAEFERFDLNEIIRSAAVVVEGNWPEVLQVVDRLDDRLPNIRCRPAGVRQAVLNILDNAAQAVADAATPDRPGRIVVRSSLADGCAEITIEDTGPGVAPEIHHRIFDPFFTTRSVGSGVGAGLAVAYRVIVDDHHGAISCENIAAGGARFRIRLPIEAAASVA